MNRIYRIVFNRTLGLFQVASETARLHGKSGRTRAPRSRPLALTAAVAMTLPAMALAVPLPADIAGIDGTAGAAASNGGDGGTAITDPSTPSNDQWARGGFGGDGGQGTAGGTGADGGAAGAGGAGGAGVTGTGFDLTNTGTLEGGYGGWGGVGGAGGWGVSSLGGGTPGSDGGDGGNGGAGGAGSVGGAGVAGTGFRLTNSGDIVGGGGGQGGQGGSGGYGGNGNIDTAPGSTGGDGGDGGDGGTGGHGGNGGIGVNGSGFTLINSGNISGGQGGSRGYGGSFGIGTIGSAGGDGGAAGSIGNPGNPGGYGVHGLGGTAIVATGGSTITNTNAGSIVGGWDGSGHVTQAKAIELSGGGNRLINSGTIEGGAIDGGESGITYGTAITLAGGGNILEIQHGSSILGDVVSTSGSTNGGDTLSLGGDTDDSFDVTEIGAGGQFQGFTNFLKTGTSTWALTNTTTELTPWTIEQGTLSIASDAALGDATGALTLNGGTLLTTHAITSARDIAVGSGGGTLDNGGFDNGLSGDITGSDGRLTFAGQGTTTFTGDGSQFTGPTTIATGSTLALAGAGSLQASALTIGGVFDITGIAASGTEIASFGGTGSLLLGDKNLAVTNANGGFSGAISGSGELSFAGTGGTTLSGVSTFSGNVVVESGLLALSGGTMLPGNVTVHDGATFGTSTATIASLDNAGTAIVTAGSKLSMTGDFTNTGTLQLNVNSMAAYGQLEAGGTATLGGELFVNASSKGTFSNGSLADVITADSITGTFDSYGDNSLLFDFTPEYTATSLNLKVAATGGGNGLVESIVSGHGNNPALGAARVLDRTFASDPTGALATQFMGFSTAQQVNNAVSQTLPLLTGSGTLAMQNVLSDINSIIQARLNGQRGLSSGDAFAHSQVWVKAFGSRADQNHNGADAGFEADTYGLSLGVDGEISKGHRVGLAFSTAKADIDSDSRIAPQSSEVDIYQLVGYGSYQLSASGEVNYQLGFGQNETDGKRHLPSFGLTATANYDSFTTYAGVGYSHTLNLSEQTKLIPSVRIDYAKIEDDSYNEKGADALNLHVSGNSSEALILGADGRIEHRFNNRATLQFNVGFGYDLMADRDALTAVYAGAPSASFVTYGQDVDPWIANGGIGFAYQATDSLEITARYDAQTRSRFDNQTASLKALWKF